MRIDLRFSGATRAFVSSQSSRGRIAYIWVACAAILTTGCGPNAYVVKYRSSIGLDAPITAKAKIAVNVPDLNIGGLPVAVKSLSDAITSDLVQNVFLNPVGTAEPDVLATVDVLHCGYKSAPWGLIWTPCILFGAPVGRDTYEASLAFRLTRPDGSLVKYYHAQRKQSKWVGLYYNVDWANNAFWHGLDDQLRGAMEDIKSQINRDRDDIVAAIGGTDSGSANFRQEEFSGAAASDSVDTNIPTSRGRNADAVGVIFACADYAKVVKVDYALRDAATIKDYLVKTLGFDEKNIIFLENPTKADLEMVFGVKGKPQGQLNAWVRRDQSDVFVYYTGHGAPDLKTREAYLVPTDAQPSYIDLQGYPLSTFYENLAQIRAKSITVVLDACFSGAYDKGLIVQQASPLTVRALPEPGQLPDNMTLMTSAGASEVSSWYADKKHSLFTYWFLKGLQGEADANKDKSITVGEMKKYVSENVSYWAQRLHNRIQTPTFSGDEVRVLARVK